MAQYFFAVEAQNFGSTIFDTEDLSTIRGGSLQCQAAIRSLFNSNTKVAAISLGASSGLWRVETDNPETVHDDIAKSLANFTNHTFGIAYVELGEQNLPTIKSQLSSQLRRQQLSNAGLTYPSETATSLCSVDLVRPVGKTEIWYKQEKVLVSASVAVRRGDGMEAKQQHLAAIAGLAEASAKTGPFALLLSSISEGGDNAPPTLKKNLKDKIAVIHVDGNGFGKVQHKLIEAAAGLDLQIKAQKNFDDHLAECREGLAKVALDCLETEGGKGKPSSEELKLRQEAQSKYLLDKIIRFEMLLWGGDEITFIVPARLGWTIATQMMEAIGSKWPVNGIPMTASIGLVFCHHDAPIARIRTLADRLATHQKTALGRDATRIFPLVLESFDHVGDQLSDYIFKRVPPVLRHKGECKSRDGFFSLDQNEMTILRSLAEKLSQTDDFSRSRLRALAQAAHDDRRYDDKSTRLAKFADKSSTVIAAHVSDLAKLADAQDHYRRAWMLLEDYWDYLLPCDPAPSAQKEDAA